MGVLVERIRLRGSKGSVEREALFDTGATYSFVRAELAEELGIVDSLPEPMEFEAAKEGEKLLIQKVVHLEFSLEGERLSDEFLVAEDALTEEVIIGAKTMQAWGIVLDMEEERVVLKPRRRRLMLKTYERRGKMAKKILIVDDDPDLVEAVSTILESKGYEVAAAYGGIEGLEKAKTENPDLIVLDVMMPDKDGYQVCKELKGDPKYSSIPILLLTAVVSKIPTTRYTQQMGMETEADDYIDKPVEPEEMVKRIEALLSK